MFVTDTLTAVIHYVKVSDVTYGDLLLSTLASDHRIVFSDKVEYTWEYDEQQYIRFTDGSSACYSLTDTVSVMRFEPAVF